MKHQNNLRIGALGEELACRFLVRHGYSIVERNFRQKCGEIDIIAQKEGILHFIEVKSVSRERKGDLKGVIHETFHRPEENMHYAKLKRFTKTVQLYLLKQHISHETLFQIDGITVYLDHGKRQGRVCLLENINC
jgi:putative endonuclease